MSKFVTLHIQGSLKKPKDPNYYEKLKMAMEFDAEPPKEEYIQEETYGKIYVRKDNIQAIEPSTQEDFCLVMFKNPLGMLSSNSEDSEEVVIVDAISLLCKNNAEALLAEVESEGITYQTNQQ